MRYDESGRISGWGRYLSMAAGVIIGFAIISVATHLFPFWGGVVVVALGVGIVVYLVLRVRRVGRPPQ